MNELRVAGIVTLEAANGYLAECFVPQHNATFARAPRDPASACVALGSADLDAILCHEETRIVARDTTVSVNRRTLQIDPQPGRRSCAGPGHGTSPPRWPDHDHSGHAPLRYV